MQDVTQVLATPQPQANTQPQVSAPVPTVLPSAVPSVTDGLVGGAAPDADSVDETTTGMSPAFKVIAVILLVLIAFVAGLYLGSNDIISFGSSNDEATVQFITLDSPVDGTEVNGLITVSGTATADLGSLQVVLYSTAEEGLLELGSSEVTLSGEGEVNWQTTLQLSSSVSTQLATIVVYPANEDRTSSFATSAEVAFEVAEIADRIKLFTPVSEQKMPADKILVAGEMKNFFEATMNYRLLDEDGSELLTGTITASADNYEQFAEFSETVDLSKISPKGKSGVWEFYEVSAATGNDGILLEVPVTFAN